MSETVSRPSTDPDRTLELARLRCLNSASWFDLRRFQFSAFASRSAELADLSSELVRLGRAESLSVQERGQARRFAAELAAKACSLMDFGSDADMRAIGLAGVAVGHLVELLPTTPLSPPTTAAELLEVADPARVSRWFVDGREIMAEPVDDLGAAEVECITCGQGWRYARRASERPTWDICPACPAKDPEVGTPEACELEGWHVPLTNSERVGAVAAFLRSPDGAAALLEWACGNVYYVDGTWPDHIRALSLEASAELLEQAVEAGAVSS